MDEIKKVINDLENTNKKCILEIDIVEHNQKLLLNI